MHRVVTMLHEHAAPVTELHGQGYASTRTQTVHIFAALLPCRNVAGTAVPGQDLAFFEVDMDRVIPASATVLQRPDFTRAELGRSRDTSEISLLHAQIVSAHAPVTRAVVSRGRVVGGLLGATAKLEGTLRSHRNGRQIRIQNHG